jgi:hypothetical protein
MSIWRSAHSNRDKTHLSPLTLVYHPLEWDCLAYGTYHNDTKGALMLCITRHSRRLRCLIVVAAGIGACLYGPSLYAGSIYQWVNYPSLQNGYSVDGTITTDGSLGLLSTAAFEGWSYTILGPKGPVQPKLSWEPADGIAPYSPESTNFQYFDGSIYADPTGLYIVGPAPWTIFGWLDYNAPDVIGGIYLGSIGPNAALWDFYYPWNGPELEQFPGYNVPTFLLATPVPEPNATHLLLTSIVAGLAASFVLRPPQVANIMARTIQLLWRHSGIARV